MVVALILASHKVNVIIQNDIQVINQLYTSHLTNRIFSSGDAFLHSEILFNDPQQFRCRSKKGSYRVRSRRAHEGARNKPWRYRTANSSWWWMGVDRVVWQLRLHVLRRWSLLHFWYSPPWCSRKLPVFHNYNIFGWIIYCWVYAHFRWVTELFADLISPFLLLR